MKYFDVDKGFIICFKKEKMHNFWDSHWKKNWFNQKKKIFSNNPNALVCKITPIFLKPKDGTILEGGCGLGQNVFYLKQMNYSVIGIDREKEIIKMLNETFPLLNLKYGDVCKLPYPDNFFAGYWSLGVIEHFYNGFEDVLKEMKRVIKNYGYIFVTFPYMSPFRKFKSYFKLYKLFNIFFYEKYKNPKFFYQYILEKHNVIRIFNNNGFRLKYQEPLGGLKGFKDENIFLKFYLNKFLQLLYKTEGYKFITFIKIIIDRILSLFAGHSILLVFQKNMFKES